MTPSELLIAVILLQQSFFGVLWLAGAALRLARRPSLHWSASALGVAAGLTLILQRGDLSPWLGFFAANVLLAGGLVVLRRGLQHFTRMAATDAEHAAVVGIVVLAVGAAVATSAEPFWIAMTVSAAIAYTMARAAFEVVRSLREEYGIAAARACAAPLALVALLFGARAVLAPLFRDRVGQSLGVESGFNTTLVFVFLALGMLLNATLVAIVVLRLVRRLEHSSEHDQLTGLLNRRGMQRILERESSRHQRFGQGYALLMIDVDHFKAVNDRFGHAAGDAVLAAVAQALRTASREVDRVGRVGGEEFCVLLPGTDLAGAEHVARRMLEAVRDLRPFGHESGFRVTVSIGAGVVGDAGDHLVDLQRRVDHALYRAKQEGRNRLEVEPAPPPITRPHAFA